METKELASLIGISHQLCNRLKKRGMPVNSLEAAIAWRKNNVDPFRSKTGRIGGNAGVKFQPIQVNENSADMDRAYNKAEIKIIEETLTKIVPGLWFGQIGWLGTALREKGIKVIPEQLIGAQSILFLLYMNEVDELLKTDCVYETPSTLMTRNGDKAYPQLIERLNQILNEDTTL